MKKILYIFFISLLTVSVDAQNFQGMAVYESKTSTAEMMKNMPKPKDVTPEMQKGMEERLKKMFERTYVLNFDKTTSIYKEEEKLDAPGQSNQGARMMMSMTGNGGTNFKNVKEKRYVVDKEVFGKQFLIKDTLTNFNWKMESETRQIGNYTCFKATAVVPVSDSDFRSFRFRGNKENSEVKKDSASSSKTNFMDQIEKPKEKTVVAWYAPEIPVNQGPENYWGLPGLILEVNDGSTTILCSKIVLNSKERVEIKEPNKGKEVSQKEFDETLKAKIEEMQEMFRNNRGGGHGFGPR
ncbi:GLPGLI family protein [Flavobacterium haoranii]|uniref:GLPGLI family protein n=1 Tax=Flavobacterium haoranii TaxID=683124 RepID=A0A1M6DGD6_9FLAO|nr:GLPGLI family protein [Flavobacterium haoranii]SHI72407.1 GLPGLI family protein [Flavobacterium haoranii]